MRRTSLTSLATSLAAAAAVFAVSTSAKAGEGWSLIGGENVNAGDMIYGEVGWPDASFGWAHGLGRLDAGVKFSLLYGYEGTTFSHFGVGLTAPIRIRLTQGGGKVNALLHFDPGLKLYAFNPVQFGIQIPIGLQVGISLAPAAILAFGFDLPMTVFVTPGALFSIDPQFGPGFEYHVTRNLSLDFNTRFGAAIFAGNGAYYPGYYYGRGRGYYYYGGGGNAAFAFRVQMGVAYHF